MSNFEFRPVNPPFPRWWGPYSPARGTLAGFRFHRKRLGVWVAGRIGNEFWTIATSPGAEALAQVVLGRRGGGRVLLLPNGMTVKPLQKDEEVGKRVLLGRFTGAVKLQRPDGHIFDLSNSATLAPGDPWPGPTTIGLECLIQTDGALECKWSHPAAWGRDNVRELICVRNPGLASGFRNARPGDTGGRVRITANGQVITNRQVGPSAWTTHYVGRILPDAWPHREEWVEEMSATARER